MKEKITKAEFINTWASEWDENTGWKVNENFHKQFSEELEQLISAEVEKNLREELIRAANWIEDSIDEFNAYRSNEEWIDEYLNSREK